MSFPQGVVDLPWYLGPVFVPAASGLLGVIVGGVITAGSTYFLDVRREKREMGNASRSRSLELMKAARLLLYDCQVGIAAIDTTISGGKFYRLSHDPLAETSWATYKAVFASTLSFDDWGDVSVGMMNLFHFRGIRDRALESGNFDLQTGGNGLLQGLRSEIDAAQRALVRLIE